MIDPEGDYRSLEALPGVAAIGGESISEMPQFRPRCGVGCLAVGAALPQRPNLVRIRFTR